MTTDPSRREMVAGMLALLAACRGSLPEAPEEPAVADPTSNFHAIYDDPALRERFLGFFTAVFSLFPPDRMHELVHRLTQRHPGDEAIYRALLEELPKIRPLAAAVTHALPALQKQKDEMARQASVLLEAGLSGRTGPLRVDGYLEMGTTGRYHNSLARRVPIEGPVFVLNDTAPSKDLVDLAERGQVQEIGTFVALGDYDPIASTVPDASLDVVSDLIGLHHCPEAPLEAFVDSVRRVLRPGGLLLLREHDARDDTMHRVVALAHDVFNAGIFLPWEDNAAQVRRFRSVAEWTSWLEARGFRRVGEGLRQDGDPTDNELLAFARV